VVKNPQNSIVSNNFPPVSPHLLLLFINIYDFSYFSIRFVTSAYNASGCLFKPLIRQFALLNLSQNTPIPKIGHFFNLKKSFEKVQVCIRVMMTTNDKSRFFCREQNA
jgi:hypothetical protein